MEIAAILHIELRTVVATLVRRVKNIRVLHVKLVKRQVNGKEVQGGLFMGSVEA